MKQVVESTQTADAHAHKKRGPKGPNPATAYRVFVKIAGTQHTMSLFNSLSDAQKARVFSGESIDRVLGEFILGDFLSDYLTAPTAVERVKIRRKAIIAMANSLGIPLPEKIQRRPRSSKRISQLQSLLAKTQLLIAEHSEQDPEIANYLYQVNEFLSQTIVQIEQRNAAVRSYLKKKAQEKQAETA